MSDALEKLQHELEAIQCALAEAEARCARHDAEHQEAATKEFEEMCKKIEQAHQEWESALDVVQDLVFMHDKDFHILRCNRAYQRCAGIPFKQIIGRPYYEVFPKTHAPLPSCLRAMGKAVAEKDEEEVLVGDTIYLSRSFPVKDEQGAYLYSVHTLDDITARKRTEELLMASRDLLQTVVENTPVRVFWKDTESRYLGCNTAFARDAGMSCPAELLGKDDSQMDWRDQAGLYRADDKRVMDSGTPKLGYEEPQTTPDGSTIWLRTSKVPLRGTDGKAFGVLGIYEDITTRKQAEETLKESEERYRTLVETSPDVLYTLAKDGTITFLSSAFEKVTGWSRDEWLGKPFMPLLHRDDLPRAIESFERPLQGKSRLPIELRVQAKSGGYLIGEFTPIPQAEKGKVSSIVRDITERKRMENQLRESEARYRRITEGLTDYQYTVRIENGRSVETTQSPACVTVTGYKAEEFAANPHLWIQMVASEDRELVVEHVNQILAGKDVQPMEHRIIRKDGESRWVSDTTILFKDASGKLLSYDGVIKDITERKKAETELFRLNRVLKTMSECNRTLLRAGDETELMRNMCQVITASGGYSLAWIGLTRQDENKSIEAVAIAGEGKGYVEALKLTWDDRPNGHGPTGTAVRTGQTQIVQDIKNDSRFELWREAAAKNGYASSIALPLKENGVVFGILDIYAAEAAAFGEGEVVLLEEVADDLAFGIVHLRTGVERDQAVKGRQHYIERLRTSLEEALQAIANTVEMRDPYTAGHQRRVAHLATAIARELGLLEEQVHGIYLAGIVHDLGKIHVPAEVLSKPGRLDEIEFAFIKTHSQVGYEILKEIQFPWPIAQAVLQHHERLDGSGYPQGLKGDAIILEARILAVADVVEAMFSHRPYRAGLGLEAALAEISGKRGICFDPQVVDACLVLFHEQHFSFEE